MLLLKIGSNLEVDVSWRLLILLHLSLDLIARGLRQILFGLRWNIKIESLWDARDIQEDGVRLVRSLNSIG